MTESYSADVEFGKQDYDNVVYDMVREGEEGTNEAGFIYIRLKLYSIAPDFTQYKKMGLMFSPGDVFVEVAVPKSEVKQHNHNQVVLTPEGAAVVASQLAVANWREYNNSKEGI